jgi:TonB family protein
MPIHNRIVLTLIVIASALGTGCATPTHVQHEATPLEMAGTVRSTRPRLDPNHMAHIGNAYYPNESRAIPEEGICKMEVTIEQDGSVSASHLVESSKFSRLDAACENAFPEDVRFIPATKDGTPIKVTVIVPIVWCLGVGCVERLH